MPHEPHDDHTETPPQAKRTGRDSADPRNQPAEFADDMATNRFTPPPDPGEEKENDRHLMPDLTVHIRRVADVAGTILSPGEADRAAQFRFDAARVRYTAARTLLRQLAAERLGIEPVTVPLDADEHGKPFLAGRPFELNLSHSGDYIAVAFAPTPIGIDIEQIADRTPIDAIAARFFRPSETAYLDSLPDAARRAAFFKLWTVKEAAIKADGMGVWSSIATVEINDPADPHTCHVNGRAWVVRGVEVGAGYCGAIAFGRR